MLGGISSRWKQTVAYHFTGASKDVCFDIIKEAEKIGIKVDVMISDMGGNNQALWKACDIVCGKHSRLRNSCNHPCGGGRQLFFMADTPHILKNLRNHLTKGHTILIPDEYVHKYHLPTREVSISAIKELHEIDTENNSRCLDPSHYDKMKLGLACRLLDHSVTAAFKYLVEQGDMEKEALNTAWFIEKHLAINSTRKAWKPVQSGFVLTTTTALKMQDLFLQDKHFKYLFLSRFTQDALKNLFSTVRAKNPVPRTRGFKMALRLITMSQFFRPSHSGSYDVDDSAYLAQIVASPCEEEDELPNWDQYKTIRDDEQQSLFYLAGYTVRAVRKKHKLCELCIAAVTGSAASQNARLCQLKCYIRDGSNQELVMPSPDVFGLLLVAEGEFRNQIMPTTSQEGGDRLKLKTATVRAATTDIINEIYVLLAMDPTEIALCREASFSIKCFFELTDVGWICGQQDANLVHDLCCGGSQGSPLSLQAVDALLGRFAHLAAAAAAAAKRDFSAT
ncbi:hypothetical protein HPB47_005650 [Ixodes persulcatus]|uniref:Uncharacterized protein n=1 Tax=Ixodes persulcatus TaxID=34615 RepID=A0AC60PD91_IXOPE|nr:hypothetical protein HPB47_005650 [Ixodes persulcatus]